MAPNITKFNACQGDLYMKIGRYVQPILSYWDVPRMLASFWVSVPSPSLWYQVLNPNLMSDSLLKTSFPQKREGVVGFPVAGATEVRLDSESPSLGIGS